MRIFLPTLSLLWLTAAAFGLTRLETSNAAPGTPGQPPTRWQSSVSVTLDKTRPTLLMLVHPKCPCTRASLVELNRLQALCPGQAAVSVLVWDPHGHSQEWAQTELCREAQAIPGVQVIVDTDGAAARLFGAATSGETLLYAPSGRLLFHGGLTGSRGHEGENAGLSAVVALLHGASSTARQAPSYETSVYGCPLTECPIRKPGIQP